MLLFHKHSNQKQNKLLSFYKPGNQEPGEGFSFHVRHTKPASLLAVLSVTALLFTGCGKITEVMSEADYTVSEEGITSKGIGEGATLEEFLSVYENYEMLIGHEDGVYKVFHKEDIMEKKDKEWVFTENTFSLLLPTFFVDGTANTTDTLCDTYQVSKEDLLSYLNSEDFLTGHHVVYHIMICSFDQGILQNILTSSRDFNQEMGL